MSLNGKIELVQLTDPGKVREHNEDAVGSDIDHGLVVVADGMGGYNAGEVASEMAVRTIREMVRARLTHEKRNELDKESGLMRQSIVLKDAVARANKIIYQTSQSRTDCEGMGTTVVAALFYDNKVSVAHVGDSRVYRLRNNQLEQVTLDHSLLQELVSRGFYSEEEAQRSMNKNYVTRALGVEAGVDVEVHEYEVEVDDVFLLCSDGLTDMMEDDDIHLTISTFSANLDIVGQQLVKLANDNGGRDNISVLLARVNKSFAAPKTFLEKVMGMFG